MKLIRLALMLIPVSALAQPLPSPTFNSLTLQNPLAASSGGTGVANTNTITLGGNLTTSGANPLVLTTTGSTSVTLPTSGTLLNGSSGATAGANSNITSLTGLTTPLSVSQGGTGATAASGSGGAVLTNSPSIANPTVTGSFTATGLVTTADHATQAANTVLANGTGSTASPTALTVPSCSATGNALAWTSGTGFTCLTGYAPINNPTLTGIATLPEIAQAATGQFFFSSGARVDRLNDRVFVGTATQYDGNQNPATGDWSMTAFPVTGGAGAYEYLVSNAMMPVGIIDGSLGVTAYGRTSDGGGGGTQATIGLSSFLVNDNSTGGGAASWNFYGTSVRTAASTGSNTSNMEIDMANLGATVRQYPNAMYPNGLSDGIGINAGGELQNDPSVTMGTNTAALTISQNDITGHANWDKGIIFQSTAIAGADGTGGNNTGIAIAMAPGHEIVYYNNSNQITGGFWSSATTVGGTPSEAQYVQLSNFGTIFTDGNDLTQFRVGNSTTSAADYLQVAAANTGASPTLSAQGTDTNINLTITGKGTGGVLLQGSTTGTAPASGYVGELQSNTTFNTTVASGTPANATSKLLPAGVWDVVGCAATVPAGSTVTQALLISVNTTSATQPGFPNQSEVAAATNAGGVQELCSPPVRETLSSPTTVYAVATTVFSVSTMQVNGLIRATRVN